MQLVINFPQDTVAKELAALAVNMSLDAACAEQMTEHRVSETETEKCRCVGVIGFPRALSQAHAPPPP